jgi:hypothetical protein
LLKRRVPHGIATSMPWWKPAAPGSSLGLGSSHETGRGAEGIRWQT